jgi:hypothetical protein
MGFLGSFFKHLLFSTVQTLTYFLPLKTTRYIFLFLNKHYDKNSLSLNVRKRFFPLLFRSEE